MLSRDFFWREIHSTFTENFLNEKFFIGNKFFLLSITFLLAIIIEYKYEIIEYKYGKLNINMEIEYKYGKLNINMKN